MFTNHFGIEIEFTGITRQKAAGIAARYLNGQGRSLGDYYDTQCITVPDGRVWKFMYDGSIDCQRKEQGRIVRANRRYSVELVSPVLLYREDIETLQGLVRRLRKAGGFANPSCGIHIHLDGANHNPRSIRNSSTSLQATTTCFTRRYKSSRSGCATVRRWMSGWFSG